MYYNMNNLLSIKNIVKIVIYLSVCLSWTFFLRECTHPYEGHLHIICLPNHPFSGGNGHESVRQRMSLLLVFFGGGCNIYLYISS